MKRLFTPPYTSGLLLVLLVLNGAGLLLWWFQRPPSETSAEVQFARDMVAHHTQAVEMALALRDRTRDDELRHFTLDLLLTQQGQIGQMQGWLAAWGRALAGAEPPMAGHATMMGMASQEAVNALHSLPPPEAEVSFLQLMIRHHEGGVVMAEQVLERTRRPEVLQLAGAIVAAQRSEIEYLNSLLVRRGAKLPTAPEHAHP